MQPPIPASIGMWFVTGIKNGPVVHRIDAHPSFHEIGPLRQLIQPRLQARFLRFDSQLSRSRKYLSGHQKRNQPGCQRLERNRPRNQIIVMTAVTMPVEIGVVLIQLNVRSAECLITALSRPKEQPLARPVVRYQITHRAAFGSRIFRMGMIVVKACAVRQDQIALHLVE